LWLYSIVIVLFTLLPIGSESKIFINWQGKSTIAFSDVIAGLIRWLWMNWAFSIAGKKKGFKKLTDGF
ncbi:MAG: hypothetical protein M3Q07_18105, partial [Pseudobdellovibrionaceae bacterium]|nr:hypothetical protein [Pseudobdellovibrionaceae bacterium]